MTYLDSVRPAELLVPGHPTSPAVFDVEQRDVHSMAWNVASYPTRARTRCPIVGTIDYVLRCETRAQGEDYTT
jgi:hypothetical protein